MSIKKLLQVNMLLVLSGTFLSMQCTTPSDSDDKLMEWVIFFIEEAQKEETPLPRKAKIYIQNNAPRFIKFVKERQAQEKARREKWQAERKARKLHQAAMDQLKDEIREMKPYRSTAIASQCEWATKHEDCQKLAHYYGDYQQYSQALLLTEKINSLQKQITKYSSEKNLCNLLEKEKEQLSQELHKIPNWAKVVNQGSYLESLTEDKKEDLKTTMENLTKTNPINGHAIRSTEYSERYLSLHDLFSKTKTLQMQKESYKTLMNQFSNELRDMRPYHTHVVPLECEWNQEHEGCQKIARYYQDYRHYSQAFLLTEKIDSLQKKIKEHANKKDLCDLLEKEKEQALQELHQIPDWAKAINQQSYFESLPEDKKSDLKATMENIAKTDPYGKPQCLDNYSKRYLSLHDLFNKKSSKK